MGLLASTLKWPGAFWQMQAGDRATGQVPSSPADLHTHSQDSMSGTCPEQEPQKGKDRGSIHPVL